jgi:hypothetical protein
VAFETDGDQKISSENAYGGGWLFDILSGIWGGGMGDGPSGDVGRTPHGLHFWARYIFIVIT